jgi:serine/threonine protein kinase
MQINEGITPERYRRIVAIFEGACEYPTGARAAFLDEACAGDEALRREVEEMLAHDASDGKILDRPVADLVKDSTVTARVGSQLGPYRIVAIIGEGGMGVVYKAVDVKLSRPAAIKFLHDDLADVAARRRFQREAKMASSLNHPHIVTVYDAGEFDGRQYLVTEFVDAGTLQDWTKAEKRSWRQIVELLVGVADALASAHAVGMMHRDIKPANILVAKNGYAKLADFGLAKLAEISAPEQEARTLTEMVTRPGVIVGTIAYMSPEQAASKPVDARSDIFSFGVVMYEPLAGRRPFAGPTELELLQNIIHSAAQPLPEEVPPALRLVIEKALEKDPADRYQAMREMVVDLRRLARQSGETDKLKLIPRKWFAAAMVAALVLAGGVALIVLGLKAPAPPGSSQYTQLTNVDSAIDPALSSDGRMLGFVRGTSTGVQSTGDPTEIYLKLLPDGDSVQLTHDRVPFKGHPRFSLDGSRIAYTVLETTGFNTYVVPVIGGQEGRRLLTNGMGMNWIDDKNILFSYMTGKGVTMAVATSTESRANERTVYVEAGVMNHLSSLSPDHKQVLMNAMEIDAATIWGQCRLAPFDGSTKGKKIGPTGCSDAAWSPDGRFMYFSADAGNGSHIWRQPFPDGKPEQITFGTTEEEAIDLAPDGRSFVTSIGAFQDKIWVHDSRGERQVTFEGYSFQPSISGDGKRLYYIVRTAGGLITPYGGLWVTHLESGKRERLFPDFQMSHYNVSRDGKRVVFSAGVGGRPGVWLAPLDGSSAPRQLTSKFAFTAFFGADGEVFFSSLESKEESLGVVYRVKEDGSNLRKAIPNPAYILNDVSPDGKYFAVSVPNSAQENGTGLTKVYGLDGGSPVTVCVCGNRAPDAPQPVSWSGDGKLFYISLVGGQTVYAVPMCPGEVVPTLPPDGIHSAEEAAKLPGAKLLPEPGQFPGPNPSLYAYPKFTSQRNIYRVPVP